MSQPLYNDQAHIAEEFCLIDDHVAQTARLAAYKIHSYKLALSNSAYCANKVELRSIIEASLLNYAENITVLANTEFFAMEIEN